MACSKHYQRYPSYECYKDIKRQFVERINERTLDIGSNIKGFEQKYAADIEQKLNGLSDVFTNLKKYLSNGHVFNSGQYNGEVTCNYISYLLCDQIRGKIYGECDKDKFNILKEFVDRYNDRTNSRMCRNKVNHLNNQEFLKMKSLYMLYDKYSYLSPYYEFLPDNYCEHMLDLVRLYNDFLNKYESDSSEFNDVLTKFEELMKTITKTGRQKCEGQYFSIREPRLFVPPVVQIPPPAKTSLESESKVRPDSPLDSEFNPKPQEVTNSSTMSIGKQEIAYPENSQKSDVSQPLEVAEASVSQELGERRPSHQNIGLSEELVSFTPQEPYESQRTYGPRVSYGRRRTIETNETISQEEDPFVVTEQLEGHTPGKEYTGVMTNIQNAISGFMKDVDPVPVVGVSGGMGALFLLFRYTPVGAFFRGGRRISNRIPSRFSGQFLGGFPGYEEFYDGGFANGPINISYRPELE